MRGDLVVKPDGLSMVFMIGKVREREKASFVLIL